MSAIVYRYLSISQRFCDVHTIASCMKKFLKERIKEQLVTQRYWAEFADALNVDERQRDRRLRELFDEKLPKANAHTLAFMILHLLK